MKIGIRRNHKNNNDKEKKIGEMAATLPNMSKSDIPSDILGSYTGTSRDGEIPDQDADDL